MITNEIIIKLKGSSKKQRTQVKNILLKNYMELLDAIEKEADYCAVDAYWKDFTPLSRPIVDVEKFIAVYGVDKATIEHKNLETGELVNSDLGAVMGNNLWTVVAKEHKIKIGNEEQWVKELNFYMGDLQTKNIDWETDYRFCEVKDKRKQVKMLGVCETTFPIKYPLLLTNGIIIEAEDYYR